MSAPHPVAARLAPRNGHRAPAQQVTFKAPCLVFVGPYLAPASAYVLAVSQLEPSAVAVHFDPSLPEEWIGFIEAGMVRVLALAPNGMFAEFFLRECRIKTAEEVAASATREIDTSDKTDPSAESVGT